MDSKMIKFRRTTHDHNQEDDDNNKSSSSSQTLASIDDLLTSILLRLPIKSLLRFKLVSKKWHSIITSPQFSHHRHCDPSPAVGLFLHFSNFSFNPTFQYLPFSPKTLKPPFRTLNFTKHPSRIGILHSCNGLLLGCSFHGRPHQNRKYYVYNPSTRSFSKLPKLTSCYATNVHGMNLAFDPTLSPHYKVLCVSQLDSGQYKFHVYSSERGPWRECCDPFFSEVGVDFKKGVYWNGAIHWLSNGHGGSFYFNLENETVQTLPAPPVHKDGHWRNNFYFGESCGHLYYTEARGWESKFDVYEIRKDYSEWFVKYEVDLARVAAAYPEMVWDDDGCYYAYSVMCVVGGGDEESVFLVLQIPGRAVRYDLGCGGFESMHEFVGAELEVMEGSLRYGAKSGMFQYIESLSCV